MDKVYGVLTEFDHAFDLGPLPAVPPSALWMGEMYLSSNALLRFWLAGVREVLTITDKTSSYLSEAVSQFEKFGALSFVHFVSHPGQGEARMLQQAIDDRVMSRSDLVLVSPGNYLGEVDMDQLLVAHKAHKKSNKKLLATVMCVPQKVGDQVNVSCPSGYRPTKVMVIQPEVSRVIRVLLVERAKEFNLIEVIEELDKKGLVEYDTYDGFLYEVDTEDAYLKIAPSID